MTLFFFLLFFLFFLSLLSSLLLLLFSSLSLSHFQPHPLAHSPAQTNPTIQPSNQTPPVAPLDSPASPTFQAHCDLLPGTNTLTTFTHSNTLTLSFHSLPSTRQPHPFLQD